MFRFLYALSLFGSFHFCQAQCSIISNPLSGIGVLQAIPVGDTVQIQSVWQAHVLDKVFYFEKRQRGGRSASVLVRRTDGRIQGIYSENAAAYFITADNALDFSTRTNSYLARKIRSLFYLPVDSKTADDEAWLYILAQHLEPAWPLKKPFAANPTVDRRIYYLGPSMEEGDAALQAYAQQVCKEKKKVRLTTGRVCDDRDLYFGVYEFSCFKR